MNNNGKVDITHFFILLPCWICLFVLFTNHGSIDHRTNQLQSPFIFNRSILVLLRLFKAFLNRLLNAIDPIPVILTRRILLLQFNKLTVQVFLILVQNTARSSPVYDPSTLPAQSILSLDFDFELLSVELHFHNYFYILILNV